MLNQNLQVPILNFFYNGIEIDLGFASLAQSIIPQDLDLSDDNLLRNVDDRVHKALNGPRVTNLINQITAQISGDKCAPCILRRF